MTGVLAFFCFHNHTIITIKDATIMSQSFTSIDAGTQRDEYGEYEIIEHDGYQVKHYIQSGTLHSMPKDIPTYPEPEGDPSY